METNFQTSFIPKKPMVPERTVKSKPVGLLTVLSLLIFFTALISTVALYLYKETLEKNIVRMENDLNLAKARFEPEKISQLGLLNKRLEAGQAVLSKHIAISPIFTALSNVTMKSVRYTKFSYGIEGERDVKVVVKLEGVASDYRSVALQSDLFSSSKYFKETVFSELSLDEKGKVKFNLTFSVDPVFVDYQKLVEGTNLPEGTPSLTN
ncbi:MAG TPA: PilN domain-containing protein [Candidatus Paceibacterota bacterium]|nr:PilN domain-containing protein [Candidatus Paceibacterota bacterium]